MWLLLSSLASRFAAVGDACDPSPGVGGNFLGFPTWYKYLDGKIDTSGRCTPDVVIPEAVGPVLLAIFEMVLRVGGIVAVGAIIFAGFQLILAQGEPEKVKGARSTIVNALIGLGIALLATAVVNVVANNIITT